MYNKSVINEDIKAMVEFVYPGVFENVSKEEMINSLKKSWHTNEYDMSVVTINIDSIYNIVEYNSTKYGYTQTSGVFSFRIKNDLSIDSLKRKNLFSQYCSNFKKTFREINVRCNNVEKSIQVDIESKVFLIYNKKEKKWFTLGDSNPENIVKFIPIQVRRKF